MKKLILVSILALLPGCIPPDPDMPDHLKRDKYDLEKRKDPTEPTNWKHT